MTSGAFIRDAAYSTMAILRRRPIISSVPPASMSRPAVTNTVLIELPVLGSSPPAGGVWLTPNDGVALAPGEVLALTDGVGLADGLLDGDWLGVGVAGGVPGQVWLRLNSAFSFSSASTALPPISCHPAVVIT